MIETHDNDREQEDFNAPIIEASTPYHKTTKKQEKTGPIGSGYAQRRGRRMISEIQEVARA